MFTDKIDHINSNLVANICGKGIISKFIGTVSKHWADDEGKLITK